MRRLLLVELIAVATLSAVGAVGFHRVLAGGRSWCRCSGRGGTRWRCRPWPTRLGLAPDHLRAAVAGRLRALPRSAALNPTMPNLVPTASTFRELARGLTNGWADLLSISLPARADPELLVVALRGRLAGAFLGAELAQRSRNLVAPVIPPLAAYATRCSTRPASRRPR